MVYGLHILTYSTDAVADRAFLRDVLGWAGVEDSNSPGWLIFKTPPTELGVHPVDEPRGGADLYLMCDDIAATVAELAAQGVPTPPVTEARFGLVTSITLPSGAELGLYQPRHDIALDR